MSKKKIIFPLIALSVFALACHVVGQVRAEDSAPRSPLIQKIIDHFNLDANEVENLVTEFRQEKHQEKYK